MKWWQRIFPTSASKTTLYSQPTIRTWTSSIRTRWKLFSNCRSVIRPSGNICGIIARAFTASTIEQLEFPEMLLSGRRGIVVRVVIRHQLLAFIQLEPEVVAQLEHCLKAG